MLPLSIGDGELCETALTTVSVPEMFRYWLQGGRITVGFLGGAQIDRFANLNTTVVGPYDKPKVRLPGGGGAPEIATSCGEIFITMAQGKRGFVDKLDFVTSLGHGSGGDSRARLGVKTKGPTKLITDLACSSPIRRRKEMTVVSLHPGVTREQVQENCGWPVALCRQGRRDAAADAHASSACCATCRPAPTARIGGGVMATREAFICDAVRTPIGRYGGALAKVRTDDLAAMPIRALMARHPKIDWEKLDEVYFGCANQAGEDNRNVARMALLLAGPAGQRAGRDDQPALRLGHRRGRHRGARHPRRRDRSRHRRRRRIDDAGAVRAWARREEAFPRTAEIYDTTIGWRFINPLMKSQYGVDSMPETGENVAEEFQVSRADQDAFALRSQQRAGEAIGRGYFAERDRPGRGARRQGRPDHWSTRTSIRGRTPRSSSSPS